MRILRMFKFESQLCGSDDYVFLLRELGNRGEFDEARKAVKEMKAEGVSPNLLTYSTLIDVYSKGGLYKQAMEVFKEFKQVGLKADVVLYTALIDALCKNCLVESAVTLLGEMTKEGIRPNDITLADHHIFDDDSEISEFQSGNLSSRVAENGLVRWQVKETAIENFWVQALALFNEVKLMDSSTASAFYNALTGMLWHFGQKQGAQLVVLEGKRRKVWENSWSDSYLALHLRSPGAARAMIHAWLMNIRSLVFEGNELPKWLSILTGWGKDSKVVGDSALRRAIQALLTNMASPFQLSTCNLGRFLSRGSLLAAWLRKSGKVNVLLLHDDRSYAENVVLDQISNLQTLPL